MFVGFLEKNVIIKLLASVIHGPVGKVNIVNHFASKFAVFARKVKENRVESPKFSLLPQWLSYS